MSEEPQSEESAIDSLMRRALADPGEFTERISFGSGATATERFTSWQMRAIHQAVFPLVRSVERKRVAAHLEALNLGFSAEAARKMGDV